MGLKFKTHEKDIHDCWVKQDLKGLSPVLQEWINVVSTYSESYKDDACYLYNERTSIGMLAAAAWRLDWVALEEFSTQKANKDIADKHANGRCDLKIANLSTSYAIEAKQAWQPKGSRVSDEWLYVNRMRNFAKIDSQVLIKDQGTHRLSAVFVSPRFKVSDIENFPNKEAITESINKWLKGLKKLEKLHAYAYIFPWRNRLLLRGENEQYIYPGTVLLISETKRTKRRSVSN